MTTDWEGKRYLGLTLDWDYELRQVHLSVPDYVPDALKHFKRKRPRKLQNAPHAHTPVNYGAKQQYAKEEIEEEELDKEGKLFVQQVLGTFLYYAQAVDSTMLVAFSTIATDEARPPEATMKKIINFWITQGVKNKQLLLTKQATW